MSIKSKKQAAAPKAQAPEEASAPTETKATEGGTTATGLEPLPDGAPAQTQAAPAEGEPKADEPAAAPTPKATKAKASADRGVVVFKSAAPETVGYDIRVRNVKIRPAWDSAQKHLLFDVPAELAEDFEKHTHVVNGRVVRA